MSDGNRGTGSPALRADLAFLCAVLLACAIGLWFGYLEGYQAERYQNSTYEYAEAAKQNAIITCADREPAAIADCVYDEINSSREASQAEQDLSAQQWMARWAALLTFFTLATTLISWFALRYLRDTFRQTAKGAQAAADATEAMVKANEIASSIAAAELRPYLFVDRLEIIEQSEHADDESLDDYGQGTRSHLYARIAVYLRNYGKVPARNIRVYQVRYLARMHRGKFWGFGRRFVNSWVCAPGHERRIFDAFFIRAVERQDFDDGAIDYIIRLRLMFEDDHGNQFTERAGFRLSGIDLKTFYLLNGPFDVRQARRDWDQYVLEYGEADEGQKASHDTHPQ